MVTIFYIAPRDESIHIKSAIERVQSTQGGTKMDTIDTIRYVGTELQGRAEQSARRSFVDSLGLVFGSLARRIDRMLERRRSRLALLEMTDEQLKDIGISRCDAHGEGRRAFWD